MNTEKKKGGIGRIVLRVFLVLLLLLAVGAGVLYVRFRKAYKEYTEEATQSMNTIVGKQSPDFSVPLTDGTTVTLSDLLADHEVVVLNVFATWCGPCEKEFPEMDAVYQKYQDKMSMVAIDVDALDTMDDVVKYGKDHNLSFPLALGAENESLGFVTTSTYPTTLIVDRNGKICFWRVGSIPNSETFEQIVTTFMGDDYTEKHPGYYTFYSIAGPGVEFTVTTKDGTETYTIGEDGSYSLFTEDREEMTIKVTSVPEGYTVTDGGEIKGNMTSGVIKLPIAKA